MANTVFFDEIHIALLVPKGLPHKRSLTIRKITNNKAFERKIVRAIQDVLDSYSEIKEVSFILSR